MYVFFIFLIRSSHIQCGSERTQRTPSELRRNSRPNNVNEDNSNRRRKTTDSFSDVKMNAILERALEKVRSAKRRISEAVKATSSSAEEEQEE